MDEIITCDVNRRLGVEIELNTPSGLIKELKKKEAPEGAADIALIINKTTRKVTTIHGWHNTHDNQRWEVKPDSSCGIEVCSPVDKGWKHIMDIAKVANAFQKRRIRADHRCSLHVHIDVCDLHQSVLSNIIAYWIKCEAVINDSFPPYRKLNRYCQFIGASDLFNANNPYRYDDIIYMLSSTKYYSLNTFHLGRGNRQSFEVRYGESAMCLDPFSLKNWLIFILHFVKCAIRSEPIRIVRPGDRWSGLYWLDPEDVFKFLEWDQPDRLSPSLRQCRRWFLGRLSANTLNSGLKGIWSNEARRIAYEQVLNILAKERLPIGLYEPKESELFAEEYLV